MKTKWWGALALASSVVAASAAPASVPAERATPKEAEAMVKKAVAAIRADRQKAFAEISDPKGPFVDRDLYIVVYDMQGTNLAHGFNRKMIGKNMIELRDSDGKLFWRDRIEQAKTKQSFWQDLKFVDPITRRIEPKTTYCERLDDMLVCGGVYKI